MVGVVLVNLNAHKIGSLFKEYEPEEARRIEERPELHHTPGAAAG